MHCNYQEDVHLKQSLVSDYDHKEWNLFYFWKGNVDEAFSWVGYFLDRVKHW